MTSLPPYSFSDVTFNDVTVGLLSLALQCAARLDEPVAACDVEKDIQTVIAAKGTGENLPEQRLPDFYSEDMNNAMNKVRRREVSGGGGPGGRPWGRRPVVILSLPWQALEKFVKLIRADLERERRGKRGVENLAKALQETPNFGGEESQQDVNDKLQNVSSPREGGCA